MSKSLLFSTKSSARLTSRSSGDLTENISGDARKSRVKKKKKRARSVGPNSSKLTRFLASTKSADLVAGALPDQDLSLSNVRGVQSCPATWSTEVGGADLDQASLADLSDESPSKKSDPNFDPLEYLRGLPLDSLVSIIRAIGADDSKCYGRPDFIDCIISTIHGGINPNYFEEKAAAYRCPICFDIHRNDTKLLECKHCIGESCYRDWGAKSKMKGCPLCRCPIEFKKCEDLTSKMNDLKLQRCPFHFECNWSGTWKELDEHVLKDSDSVKTVSRSWRRTPTRKKRGRKGLRGTRSTAFGRKGRRR